MAKEALRDGLSKLRHRRKHERSVMGSGVDHRPVDRWRRMLSAEEIDLATALTWRTARKLGYDLNAPKNIAIVPRAIAKIHAWPLPAILAAKFAYLGAAEVLCRHPRDRTY
jgi:hypothetical protein